MFIDSHCHLDRLKLNHYDGQLTNAIEAAHANDVSKMLCVAIDLENIETVLDIAKQYEHVYASVGVHPGSTDCKAPTFDELLELSKRDKVIAIGETGLDYYYGKEDMRLQQEWFKLHLQVSKHVKKPVIVHTRDAKEDTLKIIKNHADLDVAGVLHCFTEDLDMAKRAIDMNFYISFSGIVTFKNAHELQAVAKALPLERILIETDSPYLAPVPHRGKSNEPKFVKHVAEYLAELKSVSVEEIAERSTQNFYDLFFRHAG